MCVPVCTVSDVDLPSNLDLPMEDEDVDAGRWVGDELLACIIHYIMKGPFSLLCGLLLSIRRGPGFPSQYPGGEVGGLGP